MITSDCEIAGSYLASRFYLSEPHAVEKLTKYFGSRIGIFNCGFYLIYLSMTMKANKLVQLTKDMATPMIVYGLN
jgi:hypothetical protein